MTILSYMDTAVTARYSQDGVPWFADVTPKPTWSFGGKGIALYADLVGTRIDEQTFISWQAPFYANIDNVTPHPYSFLTIGHQGVTWGDVFEQFWQDVPNVELAASLPPFPPIPAELSCENAEVRLGEVINLDLVATGANIYGGQITCTVDENIMAGPYVTLGDFFDPSSRSVGLNQVDEATNKSELIVSLQNPAEPISGQGIFVTHTYTGTTPGTSNITCDPLFADRDGFVIPAAVSVCAVTVLTPTNNTISSHAKLQGREEHTGINVTILQATSRAESSTSTDSKGHFQSDELEIGSYDIKADADLYLPACTTADIISDEPTVLPSTKLLGGDAIDDEGFPDTVTLADAIAVSDNLDKDNPNLAEADINGDGLVNVQDWTILNGNYEVAGCQDW